MDEQRILEEMERKLADDDPRLASRLASFSGPGLSAALRSPRMRLLALAATLATVAVVALTMFSMVSFRSVVNRHPPAHLPTATPGVTKSVAKSAVISPHAGPAGQQAAQIGQKR
jgi:hypothetical protein